MIDLFFVECVNYGINEQYKNYFSNKLYTIIFRYSASLSYKVKYY